MRTECGFVPGNLKCKWQNVQTKWQDKNLEHVLNVKERTNQEALKISVYTSGRFPKIGGSAGQRPRRPGHIDYGLHQLANTQPASASQSLMRWASSRRSSRSHSRSHHTHVHAEAPCFAGSRYPSTQNCTTSTLHQTQWTPSLTTHSSQFSQLLGGGIGKNE